MVRALEWAGGIAVLTLTALVLVPKSEDLNTINWYATIALVVVFCAATLICLVIGVIYLWRYVNYLQRDYQKKPRLKLRDGSIVITMLPPHGIGTGTRFTFTTLSETDCKFEYDKPIQSVRFIKPIEKVIFPNKVPDFVHCESSFWRRLRNKIFGIPTPKIVVKQFTEKGIIFDEVNTYGVDAILELTPTSPQVKQPQ